ncbi:MAG: flagellar basal-body MS-ring/collar protein FliF [Acidimicrobiales bacterium]
MAGTSLVAVRDNVGSSLSRMTGPQRTTLGLAFAATVVGLIVMARLTGATPMSTLYADVEPAAAAAIVDQLEAQGVPYELTDGGRTVQVPADRVHALRLDLSAQGLPDSDTGWSVLDNRGITTSEFDQRVGYQRAMEGELAKTIESIDGISDASVHLVMPKDDLFVADDVQASASVLLVSSGGPVSPTQVNAIVNLVASSVEGLTPDRVSVTDDAGRILAASGEGAAVVGLESDYKMRAQQQFESGLEADLQRLLTAVVGPGMAVVNVSAELEFDTVTTVTEEYLPSINADGTPTVLAETTRDEAYRNDNGAGAEAGVLGIEAEPLDTEDGIDFAVPGADAAPGAVALADPDLLYGLRERDASFATNKVITNAEKAPGEVVSVSVAVVVDETAIDAGQVAEIEALVAAAAGLDDARGDLIAVSLLPMDEEVQATIQAAAVPFDEAENGGLDIIGLIRTIGTVIVAALVVVFGVRSVLKGGGGRQVLDSVELAELASGDRSALGPGGRDHNGEPADVRLQSLIANQPDDVAGVLRSWLDDADGAGR